ncbi:hypothetical protein [Streptomyces hygroscopicus]|uniref:hypothetical protein n=1 Tax=Streptomyces hygroscopicus TaxID=1912 RepID=UPI00223EC3C2|nr:hypothetical protein [Streptomyces hygroscopicus]
MSTGSVLWRLMSGLPSAVRPGHDGHTPQRLLKGIEEEFAVAAKAAAAASAAERFADEIGDSLDADMLRGIRTDEERFLNDLDHSLEEAADVVVRVKTSEAGGGTAPASWAVPPSSSVPGCRTARGRVRRAQAPCASRTPSSSMCPSRSRGSAYTRNA